MRRRGGLSVGVALAGFGVLSVAACMATPSVLTFVTDDGGPVADASAGTLRDATPSLPSSLDNDGDDAGPDADAATAPLDCNGTPVKACAQCAGRPLRCTDNGRNDCVAACADCAATTYPCLHCNAAGVVRGSCVALNANGKVQCADGNRCPCDTAASCVATKGAAMICAPGDGGAGACVTCGEPGTNKDTCFDGTSLTSGTCTLGTGAPVCN